MLKYWNGPEQAALLREAEAFCGPPLSEQLPYVVPSFSPRERWGSSVGSSLRGSSLLWSLSLLERQWPSLASSGLLVFNVNLTQGRAIWEERTLNLKTPTSHWPVGTPGAHCLD